MVDWPQSSSVQVQLFFGEPTPAPQGSVQVKVEPAPTPQGSGSECLVQVQPATTSNIYSQPACIAPNEACCNGPVRTIHRYPYMAGARIQVQTNRMSKRRFV